MEANYFTILYWFCHTSTWIHHGCTRVPHPELPSHLPPHTFYYFFYGYYIWNLERSHTGLLLHLYARQQKRHRCIEQSFGLCGRGRGWDDLGEWHRNMYNIICETNHQSRFDAWYRMLVAGALGWPRGMVLGGRWEGNSGWGTSVHLWQTHVDVWQNQYNIVISLQLK